ncbi:GNAT family N-acetyltransferase [Streptomyces sp. NPDC050509]|uniref:GNAT family N-acetyltransferase n=1 Tax=Streptomyces sp. NPDC050509 TaxID=3365620 RepID=UPI0037B3F843
MTTTVPPGLAELTEIMAYVDFATSASTSVREALGLGSLHAGSTRALAIRADPSHFFNRAGGFGADSPITVDGLVRVCDFYRERGVSQGSLMIAPPLLPPDWADTAAKLGLAESSRFTKLGCDIENLPTVTDRAALDPGWRVGVVEAHQAREWATVMMTTFGFTSPEMTEMAASCVGRANWRQYAVWADERIVAVGSVFLNGECADMFGGATLPEARGRGAQSALLTARIRAATAEGCRWLVAETGVEGPGEHNPSLRNMVRVGFEPLYERATWLWRA